MALGIYEFAVVLGCVATLCFPYTQGVKDKDFEDSFNLTDTGESEENWGNDGWKIKHDGVNNMNMTEKVKERLTHCGKLFQSNKTMDYIKTCVGEFPTDGDASVSADIANRERKKRGIFRNIRDDFLTLNIDDIFENINDGEYNEAAEVRHSNVRHKRHPPISISHLDQSHHSNGDWKIFENRHMKNPCVVTCLLQKLGMVNSSGELDVNLTRAKIEGILTSANITDAKIVSAKIVSTCNKRYENIVDRSNSPSSISSSDDATKLRCRAVIHFGKCVARNVQLSCRRDQGILLNAEEVSRNE